MPRRQRVMLQCENRLAQLAGNSSRAGINALCIQLSRNLTDLFTALLDLFFLPP